MKRFYKFLMSAAMILALTVPWTAKAQDTVTIGTGTSTSYYIPFNSLYGYSFTEQVYPASAITTVGQITAVQFHLGTSNSAAQTNSITLYMKNVSRSSFSSTTDVEPVTTGDIVFSGSWTIPANYTGWVTIELDSPFEYDGSSNLMVAMHEFTSGYSSRYFTYTSVTNSGISYYSDSYNPDPYNLSSYSGSKTLRSYLANMRLAITAGTISCYPVRNLTVSNIGPSGCTLTWMDTSNSGASYIIYDMSDTTVLDVVTDTSYTLAGLTANTPYEIGVRTDCGAGDTSSWRRITFRTACDYISTVPVTEDFESYGTGSTAFPTCWYKLGSTADRPYVNATTSYGHNNTHGLYFYATAGGYCYGIMPPVDPTLDLTTLQVHFWARQYSTSYNCDFVVGVMTDPTDATTFVAIDTVHPAGTTYEDYEIPFINYTDTGSYIAFSAIQHPGTSTDIYMMLDDVTLEEIPACPRPVGLGVDGVTSDSVYLHVNDVVNTEWLVVYGPAGFNPDTAVVNVINTTDNTLSIGDLTPNTAYDIYVMAICPSGDTTDGRFISVRTLCVELDSLPYTENFDGVPGATSTSVSVNNLPPCWNSYNVGTSTSYSGYPIVYSGSATAHSGTNAMRFYTYTTAGTYADQYAILPLTDSTLYPINALRLNFWLRSTSTSYNSYVVVGVMTNPSDPSTFVPVQTVSTNSSTTYANHNVMFGTYTGPHGCIAIKAPQPSSSYNALLIDDITIEEMPSCPNVISHNVTATASAARITWNIESGFSTTPDSYDVSYGLASGSPTTVTTTDPVLLLTGLDADSTYTVSISTVCGGVAGTPHTFTFHTLALPCIEWDTTGFGGPTDTLVVGTPGTNTTNVMPVNTGYNYSYCQHLILASEIATTGPTTFSGIAFDYAYSSPMTHANNCQIYMGNTTRSNFTVTAGSSADSMFVPYSQLTLVYQGPLNCTVSGYNYFDFNQGAFAYDGTSNIVVAIVNNSGATNSSAIFRYQQTGSSMSHRVYNNATPYGSTEMDAARAGQSFWRSNMKLLTGGGSCVTLASCAAPSVTVEEDTNGDLEVNWLPGYMESSWDLDYKAGDSSWVNVLSGTTLNSYTFLLSELASNTTYTFRVTANCTDTLISGSAAYTTPCGAISTLPFSEDFESYGTGTTAFPTCWYKLGSTADRPYVNATTSYGHNNTHGLYFYAASGGYCYAIMPRVSSTLDINTMQVSFWARQYSTSYNCDFEVGVMTNPTEANTFVTVGTVHPAGTDYEEFDVSLANYTGTGKYIAFRAIQHPGTSTAIYMMLDDVTLDVLPACPRVGNVAAENITMNSATITWDTTSAYDYEVQYGPMGFTLGTGTSTVVSGVDTLDINGLTSNTAYDVYVRGLCGADTGIWSSVYTFRTTCGLIDTLPYYEGFEGYGSGTTVFPTCWYKLGSTADRPYINATTSYGHNNSYGLYFYAAATGYCYAIMPPVDSTLLDLTTMQVNFWARQYSSSYNSDLVVGVMSDPIDATTFVAIDTVHPAGITYEEFDVSLANYTGTGNYVAFKAIQHPGSSSAIYMMLDDVTLELLPACPPVTHIALAGLDSNFLTVTWTENGTATSWDVEYGPAGFTLGTGTTTTVNVDSITITGLTPNTNYDVYITPVCTMGTSATRMGTFRTANIYVSLPFSCNFEDSTQNTLWVLDNGSATNKWYIGGATNNGGSKALYVTNDNGTSNSYTISTATVVFAYTDVMLSAPGDYAYAFDWKCYGESSLDYLRAVLAPASETFSPGTLPSGLNATATPAGWIALDGGSKLNLQTNWQSRSDVVTVTSAGVYHLLFVFRCDGSVGTMPPPAVDNIMMAQVTCPRPSNITLSNLTQTSVDISWHETGSASSWEYQLGSGTPVVVTDTTCSLTGLTANTPYTFRVRAICGAGDTSFWMIYNFRTPCGYLTIPYTQDFEAETSGSSTTGSTFVNCWTRLNNGSSYGGYPYVSSSSTYNHTTGGTRGLYWYNTTTTGTYGDYQCAVLPPVDPGMSIDSLQLSFWVKASSASYTPTFQIGVMTDPNNLSTFVGVDTITVTSGTSWMLVEVPLVTYTGAGKYVAVKSDRATSSWTAYLDDFMLDYVPTCLTPHNVTSTEATTSSITVDWTDMSPATEWQIRYGRTGGTATTVTTSVHPYTVMGLDTLTSYNFAVRAVCGVGDTSYWSVPAALSTEMCDNAIVASTGAQTGTGYYTPVNNYYHFTLTETIIDSAELSGIGEISAIAYYYDYATASTDKTNVTIWLQPTNKTVFSSSSDVVALDTSIAVQVYSGNLNCSQGWNYFTFTSNFTWDGHSNLLVIVDDNSDDYNGSSYVFGISNCTGYKTIHYYSDTYNPDPMSPSSFSGTKSYVQYRATMKLISCGSGCVAPAIASVVVNDHQSATVTLRGNNIGYTLSYGTDPSNLGNTMSNNTGVFNLVGLMPATQYFFEVTQLCDSGVVSNGRLGNFITDSLPCMAPENLTVVATTFNSVTVGWDVNPSATYEVHVVGANIDRYDTATTNPYLITNLYQGTEYTITVRSLCMVGVEESDASAPLTVSTNACNMPEGVTVSNITATTADVNWQAVSGALGYNVYWGEPQFYFNLVTPVPVTGTSYTITGLEAESPYEVVVVTRCTETLEASPTDNDRIGFTTGQTGIYDVESGTLTLYPNPATTSVSVNVTGTHASSITIEIVDLNGRTVYKQNSSDSQFTIDVSQFAQGAYFVRVTSEQQTAVRKLIVK